MIQRTAYYATLLFNLPLVVAHESCHYLAAVLLGFRAEWQLGRTLVYYDGDMGWRRYAVILAPSLVGVAGLVFALAISIVIYNFWPFLICFGLNGAWQLMCAMDFYKVVTLQRTGRDPDISEFLDFVDRNPWLGVLVKGTWPTSRA